MKTKWWLRCFLSFLFVGFFIFTNLCFANNTEVLINEIAWMGTQDSSSNEWIEFFNISTNSIDISEWSIYGADSNKCLNFNDADGILNTIILPDDFLLYANNENIVDGVSVDIWDASIGLNNSDPGDLRLFDDLNCGDDSGMIIDEVDNGEEWLAGNSDEKKTMVRIDLLDWGTSQDVGGTPGEYNLVLDENDVDMDDAFDDILADGDADTDNEINQSSNTGNSSGSSDEGESYRSYPTGSVLINEVLSDPNKGESEWVEIILNSDNDIDLTAWKIIDASGAKTIIEGELTSDNKIKIVEDIKGNLNNKGDEISLQDGVGNLIDHLVYGENSIQDIPTPSNPNSLALIDGVFYVTENVTKGKENILKELRTDVKTSDTIAINEIFPNPEGDDRRYEFIELYNKSEQDIDLNNWYLENKIGQKFVFRSYDFNDEAKYIIKSKKYLTVFRKNSYLVMNNNEDIIKLFNDSDGLICKVGYKNAKSNLSYSSVLNLDYEKINTSTKNFLIHSINKNDFIWSMVKTPSRNNVIKPENHAPIVDFSFPDNILAKTEVLFDGSDTFDVDGDKMSFIWHFDNFKVNLPLVGHIFLKSGVFNVGLEVNDGKNSTYLEKKIKVCVKEGCSIKIDTNSSVIKDESGETENLELEIEELRKEIAKFKKNQNNINKEAIGSSVGIKENEKNQEEVYFVELGNVKNTAKIGDKITTIGIVSVLPGVLGSQFFYISKLDGLQIYSYKKDFPELKLGDYIEVSGEVGEKYGEKYLNIKNGGIRILNEGKILKVNKLNCSQIISSNIGMLAEISGEVVDKDANSLQVKDETGEALIYIKNATDIGLKNISKGEKWSIVGIINRRDDDIRILPRSGSDLLEEKISHNSVDNSGILDNKVENHATTTTAESNSVFVLNGTNRERTVLKFAFVVLGVLLIAFVFYIFK